MKKIQELDQLQDWKDKFIAFAMKPRGFLLFAGKNGTGKTYSSEAIYDSVIVPIIEEKLFFTQVDLFMKWQKDMREWGEVSYTHQRLVEARLLVLDDIGTRMPSEAFKDFLYAVIEKRERWKDDVGTIITTNLNSTQMREMFGDAIVSRVASGQVFRFEGKDRRFQEF